MPLYESFEAVVQETIDRVKTTPNPDTQHGREELEARAEYLALARACDAVHAKFREKYGKDAEVASDLHKRIYPDTKLDASSASVLKAYTEILENPDLPDSTHYEVLLSAKERLTHDLKQVIQMEVLKEALQDELMRYTDPVGRPC